MWRYTMETRICKYCGEEHSIKLFPIANIIKGKTYRRWRCPKCYQNMKKARKHKIRDWYQDLKKTFKCKKCGEDKSYMLDLHHRIPEEKEWNLGNMLQKCMSKENILKEISKCDIYCSNHHRELHWKEKNGM